MLGLTAVFFLYVVTRAGRAHETKLSISKGSHEPQMREQRYTSSERFTRQTNIPPLPGHETARVDLEEIQNAFYGDVPK